MDLKGAQWKGVNWIHWAEAIYSLDEGLLASYKGQCFKEFVSSSFLGL